MAGKEIIEEALLIIAGAIIGLFVMSCLIYVFTLKILTI